MKTSYPNTAPPPTTITVNSEPVGNYNNLSDWQGACWEQLYAQLSDNPIAVGAQLTSEWRAVGGSRTVTYMRATGETMLTVADHWLLVIQAEMNTYPPVS